jgi:PKHD-type hydroxylase
MRAMFQMWTAEIDAASCDAIVAEALTRQPQQAFVGVDRRIDREYRDSEVRWLHRYEHFEGKTSEPWRALFEPIEWYIRQANFNAFDVEINFLQELQFTSYREQRLQHFDWHGDAFWLHPHEAGQRKLTCVVQLSDALSYEGGDFVLDVANPPHCTELRQKGTLLVFPSFVFHKVEPVTRGTRHSLVAWMAGPCWR